jgi:cytoskeleton protein RodZ
MSTMTTVMAQTGTQAGIQTGAPAGTQTGPCVAARSGADLKAARERVGLSIQDVASRLRIRPTYLEALEDGKIAALPASAYALAFVRTYAGALGLDAEEMVRRFRTEAAEFNRRPQLDFPVPMPERGLPTGAVVLLGLVLMVGAYAGWYRLSGEGRLPAEAVSAVPERLASLAEQAVPAPSEAADATPAAAPRIVLGEPGAPDTSAYPAPPVMAISPTSAAAAQLPPRPAPGPVDSMLTPPAAEATAEVGRPDVGRSDVGRILLRAAADSWLMVKDRAGTVLLNRVLKAGETWPVPARGDLMLTTGNAGGTEILVDGVNTAGLGGNGAVRRDLPLDAEQIKAGADQGRQALVRRSGADKRYAPSAVAD